jgi:hypothetical protein
VRAHGGNPREVGSRSEAMNINEISSALDLAISVQSSADDYARKVVNRFIPNRLRALGLDRRALRALKRELRGYNIKTGTWRE